MSEPTSPRKIFAFKDNLAKDGKEPKQEQPKPPRSAFMCFVDAKKKDLLERNCLPQTKKDVLKLVAAEWRKLSDKDRAFWDEEARNDKVRFVREKEQYKGEWILPKKRAKKHPGAPKRPMSAFLKYSQVTRAKVKAANPKLSNTDISSLLGEMWNNAPHSERAPFLERELKERNAYKEKMKEWRANQAKHDAASRTSHQVVQQTRRPYAQGRSSFDPYFQVHSVEEAVQQVDRSFSGLRVEDYTPAQVHPHYSSLPMTKPRPHEIYRSQENEFPPYRPRYSPPTGAGQSYHMVHPYSTGGTASRPLPDPHYDRQEQNVESDREQYHPTTSKYFDRPRLSPYGFYQYP